MQGSLYEDLHGKNLKIINNSWVIEKEYPIINRSREGGWHAIDASLAEMSPMDTERFFQKLEGYRDAYALVRLSRDEGTLNIVGAGNDGAITSGYLGSVAAYDEGLRSWLVVGAIDAHNISKKDDMLEVHAIITNGKYYSGGIAYFSNLFKYTSLYGIMASGMHIDSANALYGNTTSIKPKGPWVTMSGTSMATPMVSGAAALVQQKFGFLSGAQIADVLLSTASYDGIKLPKLIVQNFNNGGLYNIIYVEQDPPKDATRGGVDLEAVKQDLKILGYADDQIAKILGNLYRPHGRPDSDAILRLEKHEVIGQGILDVEKALKGLARLDANRLNLQDILNFENQKQAFYTIDTQGMDGEFSNNIEQREWNDKWHLPRARNSPQEQMKGISKVGILKKGNGRLTLSGGNSYRGATRVWGGILEIAKGSILTESSVYAERSGATLALLGEIKQNLNAQDGGLALLHTGSKIGGSALAERGGRIRILGPVSQDLSRSINFAASQAAAASIAQDLIARNQGAIELGNSVSEAIALSAGSVCLTSGGRILGAGSITIPNSVLPDGTPHASQGQASRGILGQALGQDQIMASKRVFDNQSGLVMAGFGISEPQTLNPNSHKLEIHGTYRHGREAVLQIAFSGDNQNSQIVATHYDIQGGTLDFIPTYDWRAKLIRPNQKIPLSFDAGFQKHTRSFDRIQTQSNNLLDFTYFHDDPALGSLLRPKALRPTGSGDRGVGEGLRAIYSHAPLTPKYEDYFKAISNIPHAAYQGSVDSLARSSALLALRSSLSLIEQNAWMRLMALIDFHSEQRTLEPKSSPPKSDLEFDSESKTIKTEDSKDEKIFIKTNSSFSSHSLGFGASLGFQHRVKEGSVYELFMDYGFAMAREESAEVRSHHLLAGVQGIYDWSFVSGIASLSAGVGFHQSSIGILHPRQTLFVQAGPYKSYAFSAQLGTQKDFRFSSFVLRPMVLLDYTALIQEAYAEVGPFFGKSYAHSLNHSLRTLLGGSVGYEFSWTKLKLLASFFGFYDLRLLKSLSNEAFFSDFPTHSFLQTRDLDGHSFEGGINLELSYGIFFARLGLGAELGSKEHWLRASLALGGKF